MKSTDWIRGTTGTVGMEYQDYRKAVRDLCDRCDDYRAELERLREIVGEVDAEIITKLLEDER